MYSRTLFEIHVTGVGPDMSGAPAARTAHCAVTKHKLNAGTQTITRRNIATCNATATKTANASDSNNRHGPQSSPFRPWSS